MGRKLSSPPTAELANFVDGEFVSGDREFDDINPADGTVIARVAEAGPRWLMPRSMRHAKRCTAEWGSGECGSERPCYTRSPKASRRALTLCRGGIGGHRKARRTCCPAGRSSRCREFSRLCRHHQDGAARSIRDGDCRRQARAELRRAQAGRRGRHHHPVESAAAAAHLEGGARLWPAATRWW